MPIVFACPHCNRGIKTSDAASGRSGKCPQCGEMIVVPALISAPAVLVAAGPAIAPVATAPVEAPVVAQPVVTGRSRSRSWNVKAAAALVLLIVAAASIYAWSRKKPGAGTPGEATVGLREVATVLPGDVAMVVTSYAHDRSPVSISELNEVLNRMPDWKKEVDETRESSRASARQLLGFDPEDEKAWSDAGIDCGKPFTAVVTALDIKNLDLARNTLFVLQPTNMAAAEKTLRKVWENSTDSQLSELLPHEVQLPQPRLLTSVSSGARLFAKQKSSEDSEQKLREYIASAAAHPLLSTSEFMACQSALPAHADLAGFVNLASILRTLPKEQTLEFMSAIHAVGFSSSYEEQDAFVLLEENAVLQQLRPGGESREFMARFDPPLAALSFSVADLAEFGRSVGRAWASHSEEKDAQRDGLESGEYDRFLKDSCGGVLIYPDEQERHSILPFTYVVFVRVVDPAALEAVLAKGRDATGTEANAVTRQVIGQNILKIDKNLGTGGAIVGEYMVYGTALTQIEALARGGAKGWHPAIGGKSLIEFQLPVATALRYVARKESAAIQNVLRDKLDEKLSFIGRLEGRKRGLYYHGECHGIYAAMAKILPDLKALLPAGTERAGNK